MATGTSKSYTDSNETSTYPIDKIGENTILYYHDNVEDSKSQTQTHASTASATAKQQDINCCWGYDAIGSHTFEHKGYVSWYPESSIDDI